MTIVAGVVQEAGGSKVECARERACRDLAFKFALLRNSDWPVICFLFNIGRRCNNHGA